MYAVKVVKHTSFPEDEHSRVSAILRPHNPYSVLYPKEKGKVVTARSGTLGIMCFKSSSDAQKFIRLNQSNVTGKLQAIPVVGIGKPKYPKYRSKFATDHALELFYRERKQHKRYSMATKVPKGTVCFDSIEIFG